MSDFSTADNVFEPAPRRGGPVLAPLVIGGALALVALAGHSRLGQWLRGFFSAGDTMTRDRLRRELHSHVPPSQLREILLGQSKSFVAARFGPPRTAVMSNGGGAAVAQTAFWRADTWYYAVDPASQTAMAVIFKNGIARAVEFFEAPVAET